MSREDMQALKSLLDELPTYASAASKAKVADEIAVGQRFKLYMLFGAKTTFSVENVCGDNAYLVNGAGSIAIFEKHNDGWYDTYVRVSARAIEALGAVIRHPKLPPDLQSIGRDVSPEELDAAMDHGLNNA